MLILLRLESEYNFGPNGLFVEVAFTGIKVEVFNSCYNVFSKSYVSAYFKAFETVSSYAIIAFAYAIFPIIHNTTVSVIGVIKIGQSRHIIVVSIYAPRTGLRSFSAFICKTYYITIVVKIARFICITMEIFSGQFQVFNNRYSCTYVPYFLAVTIISIVIGYISINYTNLGAQVNCIQTVFIQRSYIVAFTFTSKTGNLNVFTVRKFNCVKFSINYITGMKFEVLTAKVSFNATDRTGYISPVQAYIIIRFAFF